MALRIGHIARMPQKTSPRPVDHCVLPVADLAVARARYERLGFTVAPEGVHPFGTRNACVYFGDDSFLEPLAIGDAAAAREAAASGNVFVARDRDFRAAHGEEGFSALVMGTADAEADHQRFVDAGISAGPMLGFSRAYVDADGRGASVSFRLAFAAPADDGAFFFTCERVDAPSGGRGALAEHANGVTGLSRIVLSAGEPQAFAPLLGEVAGGAEPQIESDAVTLQTANAGIAVLTAAALKARYGLAARDDADLRLVGIVFAVADLDQTMSTLVKAGIEPRRIDGRLIVDPAPGQGALFAFEEGR